MNVTHFSYDACKRHYVSVYTLTTKRASYADVILCSKLPRKYRAVSTLCRFDEILTLTQC